MNNDPKEPPPPRQPAPAPATPTPAPVTWRFDDWASI